MATTPRDMLVEALHPGDFGQNEDLEAYITKTTRYFNASGITKPMRSILVVGLLERSIGNKLKIPRKMKNARVSKKYYVRLLGDTSHLHKKWN